jgi:hypothetical protein
MSHVLLINRQVSREEAFPLYLLTKNLFIQYVEIAKVVGICATFLNYHLNHLLLHILKNGQSRQLYICCIVL